MQTSLFNWSKAALLTALLLVSAISFSTYGYTKDKVEYVTSKQMKKDMAAAIAKARASLDVFWKRYEKPGPGERGFSLKVGISDGRRVEHFWLVNIERIGDKIFGVVSNDPNDVKVVSKGERILIPPKDISDWTYVRNGKIIGNRTLRVLMKHNESLAKQYGRYLGSEQ